MNINITLYTKASNIKIEEYTNFDREDILTEEDYSILIKVIFLLASKKYLQYNILDFKIVVTDSYFNQVLDDWDEINDYLNIDCDDEEIIKLAHDNFGEKWLDYLKKGYEIIEFNNFFYNWFQENIGNYVSDETKYLLLNNIYRDSRIEIIEEYIQDFDNYYFDNGNRNIIIFGEN